MPDIKDHVSGRGGNQGAARYFHDNADGTFSEAVAAHLYVKTGGVWVEWNGVGGGGGGGAVTVADGADVAQGAVADAAVTTNTTGTLSGKLRGLVAILADVWDSVNHRLKVDGSGVTQPTKLLDSGGVNVASVSAAGAQKVDASSVAVPVTDNAGSLTVDAPVGTPVFARLSDGSVVLIGQKVMAGSLPVALASDQSALPITDNAGSLTVDAPVGTPVFARLSDGAAALIGQKAMASSLPVALASDQSALGVTPPTLTKGTQGATGFSVQELKDAGRVNIAWTVEVAGAATTEGLATVTESRDGAATTTFTSKVVTNGKRLRITSVQMAVETLGTGTAPQRVYLRMRFNTAGAATTASPLQGTWECVNNPAVVKTGSSFAADFPDGIEFLGDGTKQIGFTLTFPDWVVTTATVQTKITITAFEY